MLFIFYTNYDILKLESSKKKGINLNVENILTIGLPVYNGEDYLASALDSLLNQTFKNFKLIISDNASTDNTENICRNYSRKDSRIYYIRNKFNIGPANNFQKVLDMSDTQYFMWAAHDDLREPTFIEDLIGVLEKNHNIILASSNFDFIDNKGHQIIPNNLHFFCFNMHNDIFKVLKNSIHNNKAMMIYGIYRTSVLKQMGGIPYKSQDGSGDDTLFLLKLSFFGEFRFYPKVLIHKRTRSYTKQKSFKNKIISTFKSTQYVLYKKTIYRILQRRIILNEKIGILKKILLIYETWIAQLHSYLTIFLEIFNKLIFYLKGNSKIQIKINNFVDKLFFHEEIL
ncbi:MAG: glycosyltransferase [Candidatus Lokiarchaeota archaeon]|nr:glycosyltransferase [Candidatus Lokiarchaeota archaeon]